MSANKIFTTVLSIIILLVTTLLVSCVGSIRKSGTDKVQLVNTKPLSFAGVTSGQYISDTKIMVKFNAATGGSGVYYYRVYLNGSTEPSVSIPSELLRENSDGELYLEIGDLRVNTAYHISMLAYDVDNDKLSDRTKGIIVSTAPNHLPVFEGVATAANMPGVAAMTQLKLQWIPAVSPDIIIGDPFSGEHVISGYYIYYATSLDELFTKLHSADVAEAAPIVFSDPVAAEYILGESTPLTPGATYYIAMRAKNSASPSKYELNEHYVVAKTFLNRPMEFSGIEAAVVPSNTDGFTKVDVSWGSCTACGEFRIYALNEMRAVDPDKDGAFLMATLESTTLSHRISGLIPHTTNYIYVVACRDAARCSEREDVMGNNIYRDATTTPPVSPFDGIQSITQPAGTVGLTTLTLSWLPADTASGVFNEYRLFRVKEDGEAVDNNPVLAGVQSQITIYSSSNPSGAYIDAATPLNVASTSIKVAGLPTDETSCFVLLPYSTSPAHPSGPRTLSSRVIRCGKPVYAAPDFNGVDTACTNQTFNSLSINWTRPSSGIFTHYEIFYKLKDAVYENGHDDFRYDDAIADDEYSVYHRIVVDAEVALPYEIRNLPAFSTAYEIGVSTYYDNGIGGIFRVNNSKVATDACITSNPELVHGGWDDIFAIGPKTSGLVLDSAQKVVVRESIDPVTKNYKEDIAGSNSGIIRLVWKDFGIPNSALRLSDFAAAGSVSYEVYASSVSATDSSSFVHIASVPTVYGTSKYELILGSDNSAAMVAFLGMTPGVKYWFKIIGRFDGVDLAFHATSTHPEVARVILPPDNMALMHRWIANQEMCAMLHKSVDEESNYRCEFNGLTSILDGGTHYYDIQNDMLIDRFENGCNFRKVNCIVGGVSAPCIGLGNPLTLGYSAVQGAIYYNRYNGYCSMQQNSPSGSNWKEINGLGAVVVEAAAEEIVSTRAYLPPLMRITQELGGYNLCKGTSISLTTNGEASSFNRRMLRKKEFIAAAAWRSDPWGAAATGPAQSLTGPRYIYGNHYDITTVEYTSNTTTSFCNNNNKGGNWPLDTFEDNDRYPGAADPADSIYILRTGSNGAYSSKDCQSRYGLQDMIGNAWDMTSDQVYCEYNSPNITCSANVTTPLDAVAQETLKNGDGNYLEFSATGLATSVTGTAEWQYASPINANYFSPALGLSLNCASGTCDIQPDDDNKLITAKSSGATYVTFPYNSDRLIISLNNIVPNTFVRYMYSGGKWDSGSGAGRFSSDIISRPNEGWAAAVRCAVDVTED
ncbi:MAG: hypothetical protein A2504_10100 [Bdellovibrionales bacterium RIFOXYD12_FULL_39_22]|nr:MAG: hypothetical protein A2385_17735 [Bdellovibrionales bacterium RIFOXYB1_FULL_39_21]OFZ43961.1 MAG: hypothetical protein A2485_04405 [Bdellovibrionales bacterium RIFOXYC12_FULL_39_17]OFZ48333.1 MAG: hypothetical protein A2404_01820 [Bdellovibrionales bacterium RIFOXYC1_FULL_39_130]OFZ76638.1 MAG: hypothetical protein A2560_17415 [Bdellovibrionales bacterium RIFOXYD1_FULL_39_84]OFZ94924.1 MAG: hypothetical protein A2504_10100 [Bdellovibrionales bacterium RIFOXYD12_FULL_39_22]HLE12654.1 hy